MAPKKTSRVVKRTSPPIVAATNKPLSAPKTILETKQQVRDHFWKTHPALKKEHYKKSRKHWDYPHEVRMAFNNMCERLTANDPKYIIGMSMRNSVTL